MDGGKVEEQTGGKFPVIWKDSRYLSSKVYEQTC